jgi:hypothetical protein
MESSKINEIYQKVTSIELMLKHIINKGQLPLELSGHRKVHNNTEKTKKKGVGGGLETLMLDGFLDEPKSVSQIIERLKKEGHHYRFSVVATKLLRMVRSRELTRIPEQGKWKYVTRK